MNKEKTCDSSQDCPSCDTEQTCSKEEKQAHQEQGVRETLSHIKHKLMVMSGKGGVGKSTVAANLAVSLARRGYSVGILDADLHGPNIAKMLGLDHKKLVGTSQGMLPIQLYPNLKVLSMAFLLPNDDAPVVWRGPMKHGVLQQFLGEVEWGDLDYLIIDLPPGTGDEPLSIAHIINGVDGAVIVTTPQEVALLDSRKTVVFSRMVHVPVVGIVENMGGFKCPHCGQTIDLFKIGGGEKAAQELKVPFLGRIPLDPDIVKDCDGGKPFVVAQPDSAAAKAFGEITDRVEEFVNRDRKET
ncbi:MAG: Mrp/NBP35 family ATP-binding protein [Deltaproteobacteria bacterium]|nr:Mrp/NBP35 family ATP-binding protein [Deltaproteobacteria bacterium]